MFFWSRDSCLYLVISVADVSRCNDFIANNLLLVETMTHNAYITNLALVSVDSNYADPYCLMI